MLGALEKYHKSCVNDLDISTDMFKLGYVQTFEKLALRRAGKELLALLEQRVPGISNLWHRELSRSQSLNELVGNNLKRPSVEVKKLLQHAQITGRVTRHPPNITSPNARRLWVPLESYSTADEVSKRRALKLKSLATMPSLENRIELTDLNSQRARLAKKILFNNPNSKQNKPVNKFLDNYRYQYLANKQELAAYDTLQNLRYQAFTHLHPPKPGETVIPTNMRSSSPYNQDLQKTPFVFRGNPIPSSDAYQALPDKQNLLVRKSSNAKAKAVKTVQKEPTTPEAWFASRHPDIAAHYAANSKGVVTAPTGDLFVYKRKGLKGIETASNVHRPFTRFSTLHPLSSVSGAKPVAMNRSRAISMMLGRRLPDDVFKFPKELRETLTKNKNYFNNRGGTKYEILSKNRNPELVAHYRPRLVRMESGGPGYALEHVYGAAPSQVIPPYTEYLNKDQRRKFIPMPPVK